MNEQTLILFMQSSSYKRQPDSKSGSRAAVRAKCWQSDARAIKMHNRPSFFELNAQKEMKDLLKPVFEQFLMVQLL
jgi:hypothetical protein